MIIGNKVVNGNKISVIELEVFDKLTSLKKIDARENVCVNQLFENVNSNNNDIIPYIGNFIILLARNKLKQI